MDVACTRREMLRSATVGAVVGLGGCTSKPEREAVTSVTPAPVPSDSPATTATPSIRETPDGGRFNRTRLCPNSTTVPGRESHQWPTVDHDAGAGGYNASAAVPVDRPPIDWTVEFGSPEVYPTLPVIGDHVYVGQMIYEGGRWLETSVRALEIESGEERWRLNLPYEVMAPPAFDGDTGTVFVYVGRDRQFGPDRSEVLALDAATGDIAWRTRLPQEPNGSPVVSEGRVLVTNRTFLESALHALDVETGDRVWRFDAGPVLNGVPTIAGDTVYASRNGDELCLLNIADGTERACRPVHGDATRPVIGDSEVYLGYSRGLDACCVTTGRLAWEWVVSGRSTPQRDWRGVVAGPIVSEEQLYIRTSDTHPFHLGEAEWLYAVDPVDGGRAWRAYLGNGGGAVGVANGIVAHRQSADDSELVAFAPDGTERWTYPDAGVPVAVTADRLFTLGRSSLYSLSLA